MDKVEWAPTNRRGIDREQGAEASTLPNPSFAKEVAQPLAIEPARGEISTTGPGTVRAMSNGTCVFQLPASPLNLGLRMLGGIRWTHPLRSRNAYDLSVRQIGSSPLQRLMLREG